MPRYWRCVDEDTWLSETRHEHTWRAAQQLALEIAPEFSKEVGKLFKKRKATQDEVRAWLNIFFKVKDYKPPSPPVDLRRFYNPIGGFDTVSLAKQLRIKPDEAAVLLKKLDKTLMVNVMEEILQAVKHSREHGHVIELAKKK